VTDATRQHMVAAARIDFAIFAEIAARVLVPDLEWAPYLDVLADRVQRAIEGDCRRLVVNMPPRHMKTKIGSVCGAAWALGRDPGCEIMAVCHSQDLAREIADQVQRIVRSPFFTDCFPATRIRDDRRSVMNFATTAGGSYLAASFDTGLTGRGADIIMLDDPLSANHASSGAERSQVTSAFDEMVSTRLNDPRTGRIMLIAHRLHEADLAGHLLQKHSYETLCLPFEAETEEEIFHRGSVFRRKPGEVLHPARYPAVQVLELKQATPGHIFATQYQQRPTAVSAGLVQRDDFPAYDPPAPEGERVISWDLASTTGATSSYSVGLVFEYNLEAAYLIDIFRSRVDYATLRDLALRLDDTYRPRLHLIEDASLGRALASDLKGNGRNAQLVSTGGHAKLDRLLAQQHHLKGKRVMLPREARWTATFLDELVAFPHGSNDDQVDALSQFLAWFEGIRTQPAPPPRVSVGFGGRNMRNPRVADLIMRSRPMAAPPPRAKRHF
jgi:predicted phage terminase large subunit-like protein